MASGMKFQFIGTGGAFDGHLVNSSAVVQLHGRNLLIDCGHSVYPALLKGGWVDRLDAVLVTHLHDDHVGSLSTLLYHRALVTQKPLTIYTQTPDFQQLLRSFLSFAMGQPERFVHFRPLTDLVGAGAIDTFGRHVPQMPTFGFVFQQDGQAIGYSGDLADPDFFFQQLDAQGLRHIRVYHDLSFFPGNGAHAYWGDLARHAGQYDIVGYHHNHLLNPPENPIVLASNLRTER